MLFNNKMAHLWRHLGEKQWDNNTINSELMLLHLEIKNPHFVQYKLIFWPTFVLDSVPSVLTVSSCFHLLDGNNSHEILLRVQKFSELTPWGIRTKNSDWLLSTQELSLVICNPVISSLTDVITSFITRALFHMVTHVQLVKVFKKQSYYYADFHCNNFYRKRDYGSPSKYGVHYHAKSKTCRRTYAASFGAFSSDTKYC